MNQPEYESNQQQQNHKTIHSVIREETTIIAINIEYIHLREQLVYKFKQLMAQRNNLNDSLFYFAKIYAVQYNRIFVFKKFSIVHTNNQE